MNYAFLVTEPLVIPYILPIEMSDLDELQVKAVEVYESKSLIAPLMLIDFNGKKVWRVGVENGRYNLSDNASELFGNNTRADQMNLSDGPPAMLDQQGAQE